MPKRCGPRSSTGCWADPRRGEDPLKASYMYMWEYLVAPEQVGAFERTYGPSGEWVELFRHAPGYVRTELHRDRSNPQRFITIDYWDSESAWRQFRTGFSEQFQDLDARCEEFTTRESEIGVFEPVE